MNCNVLLTTLTTALLAIPLFAQNAPLPKSIPDQPILTDAQFSEIKDIMKERQDVQKEYNERIKPRLEGLTAKIKALAESALKSSGCQKVEYLQFANGSQQPSCTAGKPTGWYFDVGSLQFAWPAPIPAEKGK